MHWDSVILIVISIKPYSVCVDGNDEFFPPSNVFYTNKPESLQGQPGASVPFGQTIMIETIPAGDAFTVMELKINVNPVNDGKATVEFQLSNGLSPLFFAVSVK